MVREILRLGNPDLYLESQAVTAAELGGLRGLVEDLHDTLVHYRETIGPARAIAAPQIGVRKRLIYSHIDAPVILLNPVLRFLDDEMIEVMDGCMSFPGLRVRLRRHRRCLLRYRNLDWLEREVLLEDDLAELVQHEYDHLDGILATQRAQSAKDLFMV